MYNYHGFCFFLARTVYFSGIYLNLYAIITEKNSVLYPLWNDSCKIYVHKIMTLWHATMFVSLALGGEIHQSPVDFRLKRPAMRSFGIFLSCDQAQVALWMVQSDHLSVCPSRLFHYVPFILSSYHFQGLLPMTQVMSMQNVKVIGQRSRSQRSKPNLDISGR